MKLRKVLSVLCAVAILTSTLPAAFAVEAEDLSEYAGGTVACQVCEMTENGPAAVTYNVPIPAGATKEAEREIVRSYVLAAGNSGAAQTRGFNSYMEEISTVKGTDTKKITITTVPENIGSGVAKNTYDMLYVEFVNIMRSDDTVKLTVQVENKDLKKSAEKEYKFGSPSINYVYFQLSNSGPLSVNAGNTVNTTAKTSEGNVKFDSCTVLGFAN